MIQEATTVPLCKEIFFPRRPVKITLAPEPGSKKYTQEEHDLALSRSYEEGYQNATQAFQEEHRREQQAVFDLQRHTLEQISLQHDALVTHFCELLPNLVVQSVRRVLAQVPIDRDLITNIVSEMLAEIHPGKGELEVVLCSRDLELIAGNEATFRQKYPEISFAVDGDLQPGDCVVRSRFGTFDGRVQTKLENLEALME